MMMHSTNRRRGGTLVEFSFVLLPLMSLIFGAIEMDRMFLVYTALDNAASAGVRYAAVNGYYSGGDCPASTGTTVTNIKKVVSTFAAMGILDPTQVTTTVVYSPVNCNVGSTVTVSASYLYAPLTQFFPLAILMGTTAEGTIAY